MQQGQAWEPQLLAMAYEANLPSKTRLPRLIEDAHLLQQAHDHCDRLTAEHSRSFHLASGLLPADKKKAVRALYALCRVTDDIVDQSTETAAAKLQRWRAQVFNEEPPPSDLVLTAWADTRARFHMPPRFAEQLFEGVARDLQ